ncbi:uncharacterized protein BDCG_06430 [Blastomyces dermatitidis ER-3]|uniref:Uncharacterized protein n=1 Tax=Ajellomyces dermatitidis (strain ER-3 / ATCC MYA-2586) TaxID=559297 RepID=A0ABM9YIJ8_AJEDR|nr:uncharacterized protein BDCG_06430 [Blastomyces dermatitidis ER-3]EEQ91310.2 hypothetical protein BDCG_06430 [Blastomyces dermatitidis ER-3]
MAPRSHNKRHRSAHTGQFVSKSSRVDRSASADDSEPSVESLVENLEDAIMEELPVSCVAGSPASPPAPSAAPSSAAPPSVPSSAAPQSPTLAPVSGSPAPATPVPATPTPATPGFAASAFVTSSPRFKEMLRRLGEPRLPARTLPPFLPTPRTIYCTKAAYDTTIWSSVADADYYVRFKYSWWGNRPFVPENHPPPQQRLDREIVMGFAVHEVVASTDTKELFTTVKFNIAGTSALANSFGMIDPYRPILWRLSSDFVVQAKDIRVFGNGNADVVLFYTRGREARTPCLGCRRGNGPFARCVLLPAFPRVPLSLPEEPRACFISAPAPEAILIEDDNAAETTPSRPQAPPVASSPSPAEKVVRTPGRKRSAPGGSRRRSSGPAPPPSVSSASAPPALAPGPAGPALSSNFSTRTRTHSYIGIPANLAINDINVVRRAVEESEACAVLLRERLAALESLADLEF